MTELSPEILAGLDGGTTLLVPSRQRAAAVLRAYAAAMRARGLDVWPTPDVLPWNAWLQRAARQALLGGARVAGVLPGEAQQRRLWARAVEHAAREQGADSSNHSLIEAVRQATTLHAEWLLPPLVGDYDDEAGLLLRAQRAYRSMAAAHARIDLDTMPIEALVALIGASSLPAALWFAGFDRITPRQRRVAAALTQRGVAVRLEETPAGAPGAAWIAEFADVEAELEQAALWCRQQLEARPESRLLLVVPDGARLRGRVARALGEALQPEVLLASATVRAGTAAVFALEGGAPLAHAPLVRCALQILRVGSAPLEFGELTELLRSPYLPLAPRHELDLLERRLRESGHVLFTPALLLEALLRMPPALTGAAGRLAALVRAGQALHRREPAPHPSEWAQGFGAVLGAAQWPGPLEQLSGDEYQTLLRWRELLDELAGLDDLGADLTPAQARWLVEDLARSTQFQPATGDAAVTVTESLVDPLRRYDGIWVMGLAAHVWPQPQRPDALLPLALQREAGLPQASVAGRHAQARRQLMAWRCATPQLVLGWRRREGDEELSRSPLLDELAAQGDAMALPPVQGALALRELLPLAQALDRIVDTQGTPLAGGPVKGGVNALEEQAECPFRAYAIKRLRAEQMPVPSPGIDPRDRGILVHGTLERLWRDLDGSATAQRLTEEQIVELAGRCFDAAVTERSALLTLPPDPRHLRRERARTQRLIVRLFDEERGREPFVREAVELDQPYGVDGATFTFRIDRVDRFEDGTLGLIDYKTGVPRAGNFRTDDRPVQMLAYASAVGARVNAVALAHLTRARVQFKGRADRRQRIPGVDEPAMPWNELLAYWKARLETIAREYLHGEASVRPVKHICRYCHLPALCRIDSLSAGTQAEVDE